MSEKNEFLDSPINKKFQNDNDSSLNNSNIQNMHENDDEIQSQPQVSESGKEKDVKVHKKLN